MVKTYRISHNTGKVTPVKLSSGKLAAIRKDFSKRFKADFTLKKMSIRGTTRKPLQPK